MLSYNQQIKDHLSRYKKHHMKIESDGVWKKNGKEYPHILPADFYQLNILETYRKEFWECFDSKELGEIKLHQDFNHLNSSQALAFNLLFPFVHNNMRQLQLLLQVLDLPALQVQEVAFERVECKAEKTNFDFFLHFKSGSKVFFEIKYTENGFARAELNQARLRKYQDIYLPAFKDIINLEFQEINKFLKNYQLIRNLIYLGKGEENRCVFIFPRENGGFRADAILEKVTPPFKTKVLVIYLEDLWANLSARLGDQWEDRLTEHFRLLGEKYLPGHQASERPN